MKGQGVCMKLRNVLTLTLLMTMLLLSGCASEVPNAECIQLAEEVAIYMAKGDYSIDFVAGDNYTTKKLNELTMTPEELNTDGWQEWLAPYDLGEFVEIESSELEVLEGGSMYISSKTKNVTVKLRYANLGIKFFMSIERDGDISYMGSGGRYVPAPLS